MTTITYRKTKQGEWVAFGPAAGFPELTPGVNPEITVSKKDGTVKTERVTDYGKVFTVDGVAMRYAYLVKTARPAARAPRRSRCDTCRCHQYDGMAVNPYSFDGCDYCGCDSDC